MATKRTSKGPGPKPKGIRSTVPPSEPTTIQEEYTDDAPEDDIEETAAIFDEMAADTHVRVHRTNPVTRKREFLFPLTAGEANEETIQRLAGGGTFQCRERVRGPTGKMGFGKSRTITIGGPPKLHVKLPGSIYALEDEKESDTKSGDSDPDFMQDAVQGLFKTQAIISAQQAQAQAQLAEQTAKTFEALANKKETDWAAIVGPMIPLVVTLLTKENPMVPLVTALLTKDNGPDPMETATKISAMIAERSSNQQSFGDMLEAMNSVLDIKTKTEPQASDPLSTGIAMLPDILAVIKGEQAKGNEVTAETVSAQLAAKQQQPEQRVKPPMWQHMLRHYGKEMVRRAREDKSPETFADNLLDAMPQALHGQLREFVMREDAPELIFQEVPDLREFPQWTTSCFTVIYEFFNPTEEGEEAEEGPSAPEVVEETAPVLVVEETPPKKPRKKTPAE